MVIINMHDAKSQLSDLVARAEAGEEIMIARRNKPAVRLVAVLPDSTAHIRESREQAFGSMAHLRDAMKDVAWFEPLPEDELQAWEGKYSFDPDKPDP
jgi:prevent-host-death family protein